MPPELIDRLRRGEEAAFREALGAHGDGLYAFLLRLSGKREVAEDLFQETWLALARHATRLPPDTKLGAWLYTVARNAWRSHRRWAWVDVSRWLVAEQDGELEWGGASPEEVAQAGQTAAALERALARLRAADREILLLVAVDELDAVQVAAILDLTPEAQRQRLSRARKALAEELQRIEKGDVP